MTTPDDDPTAPVDLPFPGTPAPGTSASPDVPAPPPPPAAAAARRSPAAARPVPRPQAAPPASGPPPAAAPPPPQPRIRLHPGARLRRAARRRGRAPAARPAHRHQPRRRHVAAVARRARRRVLVASFALPQRQGLGLAIAGAIVTIVGLILWVQETYDRTRRGPTPGRWSRRPRRASGCSSTARPPRPRAGAATGCARWSSGLGLFLGFALFFEGVDRAVGRRRSRTSDQVLPLRDHRARRAAGRARLRGPATAARPPSQRRPPGRQEISRTS